MKALLLTLLGIMSWVAFAQDVKQVSAEQLRSADGQNWLVLDVRTEEEFKEGHIPGAINVPLGLLEEDVTHLKADKDQPIVLYCRSGRRAGIAADILQRNSFTQLMHLEGDMLGWNKAGLPVEK